ncbi:Endoglucanase EG-II [Escovopsis weberi]|uniref:Endoglucanase EG-II n=1 Tax=Escovopsis weberi TaxID=150374 RepID=A0A0M8N0Q5_ESCWE|nr:Endoglucanase EG-II [Escovopsis weberi]
MGKPLASLLLAAGLAKGIYAADQPLYGQCGGLGWTGSTTCVAGSTCVDQNPYFYQCIPSSLTSPPSSSGSGAASSTNGQGGANPCPSGAAPRTPSEPASIPSPSSHPGSNPPKSGASDGSAASSPVWGQCGGQGWTGPTTCDSGSTCVVANPYYSQCLPGDSVPSGSSGTPTSTSTTMATVTRPTQSTSTTMTSVTRTPTSTSTAKPSSTTSATPKPTGGSGRMSYVGVNIAGFDFGCDTNGDCPSSLMYPPIQNYAGTNNYPDGVGQMKHFGNDLGYNIFRLPLSWGGAVHDSLGGDLDEKVFAAYDQLIDTATSMGSVSLIDLHSYARWQGGIIGQGGPTNDQFVSFWTQVAQRYKDNDKVWFGLMNEPWNVDIQTWSQTLQAAVTAIRQLGANNIITLPGNDWQGAGTLISDGSAAALDKITNPDGSKTGLILDVHKYLDSDNSGTNPECTTNNIDTFQALATWLRANKRQAILTETGGGSTQSCLTMFCQQIEYLHSISDVMLGVTMWAAGSFDPNSYPLAVTPVKNGNTWVDKPLLQQCLKR